MNILINKKIEHIKTTMRWLKLMIIIKPDWYLDSKMKMNPSLVSIMWEYKKVVNVFQDA